MNINKYKLLISEVGNMLKASGFKRNKESFFFIKNNNIGIINFQKSQKSSLNKILFTIDLGVYISSLNIFDRPYMDAKPSISDCHWRKRIGFLMSHSQDYWWEIEGKTILSELELEVLIALNEFAIPLIKLYLTENHLEELWMVGMGDGLTQQQMYIYLIALMKINNRENIEKKVEDLRQFSKGKVFEQNVRQNLIKIGIML